MVGTAVLRPGGLKVCQVRSTGHIVDLTEDEAATVLFPTSGQLRVQISAAGLYHHFECSLRFWPDRVAQAS